MDGVGGTSPDRSESSKETFGVLRPPGRSWKVKPVNARWRANDTSMYIVNGVMLHDWQRHRQADQRKSESETAQHDKPLPLYCSYLALATINDRVPLQASAVI